MIERMSPLYFITLDHERKEIAEIVHSFGAPSVRTVTQSDTQS